jgi:hypothetical protein
MRHDPQRLIEGCLASFLSSTFAVCIGFHCFTRLVLQDHDTKHNSLLLYLPLTVCPPNGGSHTLACVHTRRPPHGVQRFCDIQL